MAAALQLQCRACKSTSLLATTGRQRSQNMVDQNRATYVDAGLHSRVSESDVQLGLDPKALTLRRSSEDRLALMS